MAESMVYRWMNTCRADKEGNAFNGYVTAKGWMLIFVAYHPRHGLFDWSDPARRLLTRHFGWPE